MEHNLDLETIVTPVNIANLKELFDQSGYDKGKADFLIQGFSQGFDIGYAGPREVKQTSPNLKITVGSEEELWNKVIKEVKLKRYAGPFKMIPFEHYIQSPIGLVPKDNGRDTRLIFHLSYPRNGKTSLNANTPQEICTVKYGDFNKAIQICLAEGKSCRIGKSDMKAAFRNLGIRKLDWPLLVMKCKNSADDITYYFVDKCLPFGSSRSCALFQAFSDAITYLVRWRCGKKNVNYLDDFLFCALLKAVCDGQIDCFLKICQYINFPVSLDKTF